MMKSPPIGIDSIGFSLGNTELDNLSRAPLFSKDVQFVKDKLGFHSLRRVDDKQNSLSLCEDAVENLLKQKKIDINTCDCLMVVTQNPDNKRTLPHVSAILHERLQLPTHTACFDISLGCSGYIYALSILSAFMQAHGFKSGLIFTADSYSHALAHDDAHTQLLFGDAATCTLLSDTPQYVIGKSCFATQGKGHKSLYMNDDGIINMKGRDIFNFCMTAVPTQIQECMTKNAYSEHNIDALILHQASRYIVENVAMRAGFSLEKTPFLLGSIGNCVSSTIPIMLAKLWSHNLSTLLLSGFGVGLSWATTILYKHGE